MTPPGPTQRAAASFRDRSGQVFFREQRVFRAIDSSTEAALRSLERTGFLEKSIASSMLVGTKWADPAAITPHERELFPQASAFLEHERLGFISYPYEWSTSMLADAALLTLDLQMSLLQQGCSLKDASAYNIQFRPGKPLFIDVSSIEKPERLDLWYALGQFQRMFLFPLLLRMERGLDLRSYFLAHLDGWQLQQVVKAFPGINKWRPSLLLDLTLPAMLDKSSGKKRAPSPGKTPGTADAQLINLRRLRNKITKLATACRVNSDWSSYTQTCTYNSESELFKKEAIRKFLEQRRPARVLDLGCNTGEYSLLASGVGAEVLAADADHDAVELLYRKLRNAPARINPLVIDIANPSPAIGFLNRERASFLERANADCLLALALIHHLHVSANFPLEMIAELFATLAGRLLVLEFVPREDEMFQKLIAFRRDIYHDYSIETCLTALNKSFNLLHRQQIPGSPRTLLFFQKR